MPELIHDHRAEPAVREMARKMTAADIQANLTALEVGLFGGMSYVGPCGCLIGTAANARWNAAHPDDPVPPYDPDAIRILPREANAYYDVSTALERVLGDATAEAFVVNIQPGDTIHNSAVAYTVHQWLSEALAERQAAPA